MRSGSTLLAHILASHPEFVGAGESHISYRKPADLAKLLLKTCELLHQPILRGPYVVDQINHEYVTDEVLRSNRIYKCIILLRQPEATLKSMINLAIWPERQALEIYVNRLETLTHYGLLLRERSILVRYDDLVDRGDATLGALTSFFGLQSPLTPKYATHRMTARVAGFGDPSQNIKVGHIIRTPKHKITVSEEMLTAAECAFNKCWQQLRAVTAQATDATASSSTHAARPTLNRSTD
jgi:hypothetical protein